MSNSKLSRVCFICGSISVTSESEEVISFHRFPNDKKNEWLKVFCIEPSLLKCQLDAARLCSRHFVESDFTVRSGRRCLKANALPTITVLDENKHGFRKRLRLEVNNIGEVVQPNKEQNQSIAVTDCTQNQPKAYPKQGRKCIICGWKTGSVRTYFTFPKDEERKTAWLLACNVPFPVKNEARVCDIHFQEHDFTHPPSFQRRRLKLNAVPTLFLTVNSERESRARDVNSTQEEDVLILPDVVCATNATISTSQTKGNTSNISATGSPYTSPPQVEHSYITPNISDATGIAYMSTPRVEHSYTAKRRPRRTITAPRYPGDICTPHVATPRRAKKCVEMTKSIIVRQRREIHNLRKTVIRAKNVISNLKSVIKALHIRRELDNDTAEHLMVNCALTF